MKIKKKSIFFLGISLIFTGVLLISIYGFKKIRYEIKKNSLLKSSVILEIPSVDIYVPVVEGTDGPDLHMAAGHFENTGKVGSGNYCIAGHNSTIYAEIFNTLSGIKNGDIIYLIDNDDTRTKYTYIVTDIQIVLQKDTWILNDYHDNRVTIMTCTDNGKQRLVVTGIKKNKDDEDVYTDQSQTSQ